MCFSALCGGLGIAGAGMAALLPPGATAPPIQVLMETKDPLWLVGLNRTLQMACLAEQGIAGDAAEALVKPVPKPVLEAFVSTRVETLFDGARQASYRTEQFLYLYSKSADCGRPKLVRAYQAEVDDSCELSARGRSYLPDAQTGQQRPVDFRSGAAQGKTRTCRPGPAPKRSLSGLPVYQPGGVSCVSSVDAMLRAVGRPVEAHEFGSSSTGIDTCLLAELPYYNGEARPVVVALAEGRTAEQIAFDADLARGNGGRPSTVKLLPVKVSAGPAVPAQRFTAAAARSFVNQASEFDLNSANAALK